MSTLPRGAYGDTLPVVNIEEAKEGKGEARHTVGVKFTTLLPFDHCAPAPITITGLEITKFPSQDILLQRNVKLQLLVARFHDLEISFRGGDYGAIIYSGRASGVEFLNLNPPAPPAGKT